MRRKDKEITNRKDIDDIINKAIVCRIGLIDKDNDIPYIIPVNFGYDGKSLYIHTAKTGRKIDLIKKNNIVCFEIDIDTEIIHKKEISRCSSAYKSVIGYGKAYIIEDEQEKKTALDYLMNHYSEEAPTQRYDYQNCINEVGIIRIDIESISGKQSPVN
jgi:uncharacterized protein